MMKNISFPFGLFLLIVIAGCNPTEEADQERLISYNDSIIAEQDKVINQLMDLNMHINNLDHSRINEAYTELLRQTERSTQKIKEIGPYRNDSMFLNATLDLFDHYQSTFNNEYDTIIEILAQGEANITQPQLEVMDSISKVIEGKESEAFENFQKAHQQFAEKYDLTIVYKGVREEEEATE